MEVIKMRCKHNKRRIDCEACHKEWHKDWQSNKKERIAEMERKATFTCCKCKKHCKGFSVQENMNGGFKVCGKCVK